MAEDGEANNTIRLIYLIKQHPVLWDNRQHSRRQRNEAWNEVLTSLIPDLANLDQEKIKEQLRTKWNLIRGKFKRYWKEGKTGGILLQSGCKIQNELDFLLPVFEEKEKRQPSFINSFLQEKAGPSNVFLGAMHHTVDPDAETVVNYKLKNEDLDSNNSFEIESSSGSSNDQVGEAKLLSRTNPTTSLFGTVNRDQNNILQDSDNLRIANGHGRTLYEHFPNDEEGYNKAKPPHTMSPLSSHLDLLRPSSPCSVQGIGTPENKTSSQSNAKGIKRPYFDENKKCDQEQYLLNLIESFTENFDCSQNTNFSLEILPLLQSLLSKGSNLSNEEMKDFNTRALRVLLSTIKNLESKERLDIMTTVFLCVQKANK